MTVREVSKEAFYAFIEANKDHLVHSVANFSEPHTSYYLDKRIHVVDHWVDQIVASVTLFESFPKDGVYPWKWAPNKYRLHMPASSA